MNINHLHLKVRSVERARSFYQRFFGLRDFVWHGDMLFMRDGAGMDLALAPTTEPTSAPEWFHLGFRLDAAEQVEELYADLNSSQVPIRHPLVREDDLVSFRCEDPDGYGVEIYWERQPG